MSWVLGARGAPLYLYLQWLSFPRKIASFVFVGHSWTGSMRETPPESTLEGFNG